MKKLITFILCATVLNTGLMAITKTVGTTGANYATLGAAFTDINMASNGMTGTIELQIIDNTTEAATVLLNKSGVTVLIYPTVAGKTIWGDLNSSLITIEATNNVTIDGRVNRTGTTPDLTIDNPNTGATAATITISSTSANNTVSYCNIKGSGSTLATIPITATNGTNYLNNTLSYNKFTPSTGGRPMTVCSVSGTYGAKLLNNNFENVVKTYGISANNSCVKSKISGNSFYETADFTPTVAPTYIYFTGNNAPGATNDTISNNYIGGSEAECAGTLTTTGAFNFDFKGISLKNIRTDGLIISNNTIKNITWTNNSPAFFKGITNEQNSTSQGSNIALSINNNFISNIEFSNSTGATTITGIEHLVKNANIYNNIVSLKTNSVGIIYGIKEGLGAYNALTVSNIYNNTVYIGGSPTSGSSASYAFHSNANTNSRDFRNNIFYNARSNSGSPAASGKHYAIQLNYAATVPSPNTNAVTFTCNYNDYYVTGTGKILGRTNNTDKSSLTDWQTYTGQDANSSVTDPVIVPGATPESYKGTAALTGADLSALIGNKDFVGDTRKTLTQMGAFFIPGVIDVSSDKNISELVLATSSQIEVGAGATLTLNQAMNTEISKIVVKPTGKISLGSNAVTATNGILLQSDATGTATLTGDNAVANATVQQYVTAGRNWYISPSVTAGTSSMISLGDSVVAWNESSKKWDKITGSLAAGRGYIQTAVLGHGTTGTVNFTGTTNAGVVTTPSLTLTGSVATSGFNLVGNPYPSYLRWSGLNSVKKGSIEGENRNTGVGTSFWYRTKNDENAYIFVTHNGTSGYTIPANQTPNTTITGIIPPMQAFWVKVNDGSSPTTMTFTNDMRLHADNAENKFKAPKNDDRKRLRLQLANGTATDEALIYFDAAAENGFDNYDSPKMLNNSSVLPDIYSKSGSEKVVMNGLNSVADNMTLPLGFTLKAAATGLKLKVSELSNFSADTKVYLIDNANNSQTELLPEAEYSFDISAATTNNESRFSLLFRAPNAPTDIDTIEKLNAQVYVNAANQISIVAPEKSNYAIYNAMGQLMENGVLNTERETRNTKLAAGVYVVRVGNQSTRVIIK